jgi:hypothetical protein
VKLFLSDRILNKDGSAESNCPSLFSGIMPSDKFSAKTRGCLKSTIAGHPVPTCRDQDLKRRIYYEIPNQVRNDQLLNQLLGKQLPYRTEPDYYKTATANPEICCFYKQILLYLLTSKRTEFYTLTPITSISSTCSVPAFHSSIKSFR